MRSLLVLALALLVAGCGASGVPKPSPSPLGQSGYPGWPPNTASTDIIPVVATTELVVGPNRVLVHIIDQKNEPLASPDRPAELRFYDLASDPTEPAATVQGSYIAAAGTVPGLYRAEVTFDRAGDWGLEVVTTEADGSHRSGRMMITVQQTGSTPAIGAQAPSTDNPTATTPAQIAQISTDDNPDPDFYRETVAQALAAHEPFALVFATPAFCQTQTCGPTLDTVKSVAADYKGRMTFINVEPYKLAEVDGQLQPVLSADNLPQPVDAVNQWGLRTEPYTFVVDSNGKVTAKFEGMVAPDELRAAFDAVASSAPAN